MNDYLAALGLTLVVEIPVYVVALGLLGWRLRIRADDAPQVWAGRVVVATGVSLVTHPAMWWSFNWGYQHGADVAWLAGSEVVVVIVEALLIWLACKRRRRDLGWALLVSLAANAASLVVGMLVG